MKHIATINFTEQVSPDDWERTMKHLEVTPETTVQEIIDWMKGHDRGRVQSFVVREVEPVKKYTTEPPSSLDDYKKRAKVTLIKMKFDDPKTDADLAVNNVLDEIIEGMEP